MMLHSCSKLIIPAHHSTGITPLRVETVVLDMYWSMGSVEMRRGQPKIWGMLCSNIQGWGNMMKGIKWKEVIVYSETYMECAAVL